MNKEYIDWFPGDKIVCVNTDSIGGHKTKVERLTIGKIYTVQEFEIENPSVINDIGFTIYYDRIRFITLEEWREKQINKIIG